MSETAWCTKSLGKYCFAHFPLLITLINHLKFGESTTDVLMQYGLLHSQSDMFTAVRSYNDTWDPLRRFAENIILQRH